MKKQGGGAIINTASIDAYRPQYNVGIYSISKAAVVMATKSMAYELAPFNIRVNAVAPGYIDTHMLNSTWAHLSEDQAKTESDSWKSQIPLKRFGQPDEIAWTMVFLASSASSYLTGETIVIDGGELLGKH
jgi:NAD(P)-dependent dehydrogenase (short-subunit alcohol dehydrogenase family)